ncbi:hypothetical protein A2U01_0111706 [Trifolium medium]|uniref:Uncharacterized protein n=1 Tax=Trifolium medium TaxID=97028 RepID=A0A392VPU9_9FABA|nr:hypothetical protein [Trifolium medium]
MWRDAQLLSCWADLFLTSTRRASVDCAARSAISVFYVFLLVLARRAQVVCATRRVL